MVRIPQTNIRVDCFKYQDDTSYYIYFLTHMHCDHIQGLNENWNRGPIYCSPQTANLLKLQFPNIQDIHPLQLNEPHWIYLDRQNTEGVNVTLVDANHCPGSVMLIFQGHMGTIFHTGDFRFHPGMFQNEFIQKVVGKVDRLFLDNTFSEPKYTFPSQQKCAKIIKRIISNNFDNQFWISTESLGKEELMIDLARTFHTKIVVNQDRYQKILALDLQPQLFTTDAEEGYIHIVRKQDLQLIDSLREQGEQIIGIKLTGFNISTEQISQWKWKVPYSLHSNFAELIEFVNQLKPKEVTYMNMNSGQLNERINIQAIESTQKANRNQYESGQAQINNLKRPRQQSSELLQRQKRPILKGARIV